MALIVSTQLSWADESLDQDLKELEKSSQQILKKTENLQKMFGITAESDSKNSDKKRGLLEQKSNDQNSIQSKLVAFVSRDDIQKSAKKIFECPKKKDLFKYQGAAFLGLLLLNFILKRIFSSFFFRILLFLAFWPFFFFQVYYFIPHLILGEPFDYIAQELWKVILTLKH